MAVEGLSDKLNNVFKRLKSRGKLTEADVKEAMREVRLALLEADVSYKVVKEFVAKVNALHENCADLLNDIGIGCRVGYKLLIIYAAIITDRVENLHRAPGKNRG